MRGKNLTLASIQESIVAFGSDRVEGITTTVESELIAARGAR